MNPIGSLPPHIAQAYGARSPQPAPRPPSVEQTGRAAHAAASADRLVAGQAGRPIDFDGATLHRAADVLPLYTRAADKVEAAVAVQVGRQIDVRG